MVIYLSKNKETNGNVIILLSPKFKWEGTEDEYLVFLLASLLLERSSITGHH